MKKAMISLCVSCVVLCMLLVFVAVQEKQGKTNTRVIRQEPLPGAAGPVRKEESQKQTEQEEPVAELPQVELVMIGDMLMHTRVLDSGKTQDGAYSYDHLFRQVKDKVEQADLAIVNQETILGGTELGLSSYPCFNSPYELGDAEVRAGFDVILHGTNHALDKHARGINNCMQFWNEKYPDIAVLGIHDSWDDQKDIYVYTKEGIRIAVLNYTYGTNGIEMPDGMEYCVDYLEEERVRKDVEKAKELSDFVVVCPHWGTEYQLTADASQKRWCEKFLDWGVDLVIGTHPHVIEPVEMYTRKDGSRMLVYYSLGNFVNGTESKKKGIGVRMIGGMADVTIGYEPDGTVGILSYSILPVVCHEDEGTSYTVYFLEDYTKELAKRNWIVESDPNFSKEYCDSVVREVWGKESRN
ncbi:MAG: CapA family protein [Agathobacter sp.]|uniref:CapA family protein n=1 Tax=Agathobacter sp. TaxID=2021311 RepID=UPI00257DA389|nr:CapA family protein [Agathobacter sp.]MBQ1680908.1 CapA family protein [Agathobacter sp.]